MNTTTKRKTILITGGSSGIGLDLAKAYAKQGCNIVLLARDQVKLYAATQQCQEAMRDSDQTVHSYSVDVADKQTMNACAAQISERSGTPDVMILSAGIAQCIRFSDQTDEDFEGIMNINVYGSRNVVTAFLDAFKQRGSGQICFVSSLAGFISIYGYSAYGASKFAVLGMAGALKQELHEYGIGISVLCPPEVDTPMIAAEESTILPQTRFLKKVTGRLPVSQVTHETMRGIEKKRYLIVPGIMAKLTLFQARVAPRLFALIAQWMIKLASK